MAWQPGELPTASRELDLYDVSFLMSSWGGSLSLDRALDRVGISEPSYRRWTADPGRFLPPGPVTSWPGQMIDALDSSQATA